MRFALYIFLCSCLVVQLSAQNKKATNTLATSIKAESTWERPIADTTSTATINPANIVTINDDISYYSSSTGLFITLNKPTTNVNLLSLTGESVWKGNLVQGRFLIPIKQGIYFLRINNKSYKVIRK